MSLIHHGDAPEPPSELSILRLLEMRESMGMPRPTHLRASPATLWALASIGRRGALAAHNLIPVADNSAPAGMMYLEGP